MTEENNKIPSRIVEISTKYLEGVPCKNTRGTFTKDANKGNAPKASDVIKKIKRQTTNEGSE